MLLQAELAQHRPGRDSILTVGVFDGVHLGHRHLIALLKKQAREKGGLAGVVTFRYHPVHLLAPDSELAYLTSLDEKVRLLKESGADFVVVLSFTEEVAGLRARQFVALLQEYLHMKGLVVGPDFALGWKREGDIPTLRKLGEETGFSVEVAPPFRLGSEVVSSTAIRQALSRGEMSRVTRLLGRPYQLGGRVVSGVERGRKLGFPTANLEPEPARALPPDGVYATRAYLKDGIHPSVINIGVRPTFGEGKRTIEVFLLDFQGDLYGQEMSLELVRRLRGEVAFASAEELKEQIRKDIEQARACLGDTKF